MKRDFRTEAMVECQFRQHQTNDPYFSTLECLDKVEHVLRQRDYMERIQPFVRLRAKMAPIGGFSFVINSDGSLGERIDHWSPQQLETIAQIESQIASIAEEFGNQKTLTASPAPRS